MASDEAYIAAAMRKGLFIAHSRDVFAQVGIKSGGDFAAIEITDEEAEAEQHRIDARMTVTDEIVEDIADLIVAELVDFALVSPSDHERILEMVSATLAIKLRQVLAVQNAEAQ